MLETENLRNYRK